MSQRASGYERKPRDLYETPEWVTAALLPHLPAGEVFAWECAAGSGKMARALGPLLWCASDACPGPGMIGLDFLSARAWPTPPPATGRAGIITNPPYEHATKFCEHALSLTILEGGFVAMLLRTDFDHAKTRARLFAAHPAFARKVVLTRRITWFEPEPGETGKSPSFNHAWFIWDWQHRGPPTIGYAP